MVGFGRWLVFSKTVGAGCVADAYNTANQVPNVLFEVVAGGALAGVVIPLLAGPVRRGETELVSKITSALMSWALVALVPVVVIGLLARDAYLRAWLGSECAGQHDVAAMFLAVFLPQVFGYAIAVICSALLQTWRQFFAAAVAPLVSSAIVIGGYLAYAAIDNQAARTSVLAWATTAGVAGLAATVAVAVAGSSRRHRLRLRPSLRFPPGTARRAGRLATAATSGLIAQQLAFLVFTWLANHRGSSGSTTLYTWAYAIFLLPVAILVTPVTTTTFPRIAGADSDSDADAVAADRLTARSIRAVLIAALAGGAVLVAVAPAVAGVFVRGAGAADPATAAATLQWALVAFAPAVAGWGLVQHCGRLLYAREIARPVALWTSLAWFVAVVGAAVASAVLAAGASGGRVSGWVPAGLAIGNTAGMTCGAVALTWTLRVRAGRACVSGAGGTIARWIPIAILAAVAGRAATAWFDTTAGLKPGAHAGAGAGLLATVGVGLLAAVVTTALGYLLARLVARDDLVTLHPRLAGRNREAG